jgi:hypothetical protein
VALRSLLQMDAQRTDNWMVNEHRDAIDALERSNPPIGVTRRSATRD